MAEDSKIEWTDHTFNPWIGCTKVSPGCQHCYAETLAGRYGWAEWGKGNPRKRTSVANWKKPIQWNKQAIKDGTRPKVFCASLADWLDHEVPIAWFVDLLDLIFECPHIDWLLLSKRVDQWNERMREALEYSDNDPLIAEWWHGSEPGHILPGTSAEDQKHWDKRVPHLMKIPAKIHFVSAEPLLGPIVMGDHRPEWLIVGGESGPGARPMDMEWPLSLEEQCGFDKTAFFMKQLDSSHKNYKDFDSFPELLKVREYPQ